MKDSEEFNIRSSRFKRYAWVLAVVWTVIIAASLVWNVIQVRRNTLDAARIQARAAFEKDVIYRRWNAEHGGVYALVTEETQPNPYLKVSERDVMTPLRKPLTLINPAYMTRQVHELAEEKYG
ncbi:MAG: ATPase, partial [Desulfobulbaceae bacterium]|nr:ATPase [Desulfobulbaceae bacterium]